MATDQLKDSTLLEGLDSETTKQWQQIGGTDAGAYFRASPGVVVAVPRPLYVQNAQDAIRSLEEFNRLAREAGSPLSVVVLVDRVISQDGASRRVWSEGDTHHLRRSLALVCSSPLSRAIGSFFIGLNRPPVPTKMFKYLEQALRWSQKKQDTNFEELDWGSGE
jgi:hypothetical protein